MTHILYCLDVETTGLDPLKNEVIELSIKRMSDGEQRTWFIKPNNINDIDPVSLKLNHHVLEDLLHKTVEGREKYKPQEEVLIDIENFLNEDGLSTRNRVPMGQNIGFDVAFLNQLWKNNNAHDTYPFGYHVVDTMIMEFMLDLAKGSMKESYSLSALSKHYGVKNEKAHSADADVRCTAKVFEIQIDSLRKMMK
mgnify:FL=1